MIISVISSMRNTSSIVLFTLKWQDLRKILVKPDFIGNPLGNEFVGSPVSIMHRTPISLNCAMAVPGKLSMIQAPAVIAFRRGPQKEQGDAGEIEKMPIDVPYVQKPDWKH